MLGRSLLSNISCKFFRGKYPAWYKIKLAQKTQIAPDSWTIFPGDLVKVVSGKFEGQSGEVKRVLRKRNQIIVKGVNTRAIAVSQSLLNKNLSKKDNWRGFMVPCPITATDVKLIDPLTEEPTEVTITKTTAGRKIRTSLKTNTEIKIKKTYLTYNERKGKKKHCVKATGKRITTLASYKGPNFDYLARLFTNEIRRKEETEKLLVMRDVRE